MMHSDAIVIDYLEVGTANKVLKARMLSDAFLRCLKLQKENNITRNCVSHVTTQSLKIKNA